VRGGRGGVARESQGEASDTIAGRCGRAGMAKQCASQRGLRGGDNRRLCRCWPAASLLKYAAGFCFPILLPFLVCFHANTGARVQTAKVRGACVPEHVVHAS